MNWKTKKVSNAGLFNGASKQLWVALGDNASDVAVRINSDPTFVANVARFMVNGGYEMSISQRFAREIMGRNFFGIEEAMMFFGVKPKKQELATLAKVSFSEEVLNSHKDTHVLVAMFPLSLLDVRTIAKKFTNQVFSKQDWYEKQPFSKEKGKLGWQLLRKELVTSSTSKNWSEQQSLLKDEETPKAQIVVYAMIGHFLNTGERLFEVVYARCSDLDSDGGRVDVGHFGPGGLSVGHCWDGSRYDHLGLAAVKK